MNVNLVLDFAAKCESENAKLWTPETFSKMAIAFFKNENLHEYAIYIITAAKRLCIPIEGPLAALVPQDKTALEKQSGAVDKLRELVNTLDKATADGRVLDTQDAQAFTAEITQAAALAAPNRAETIKQIFPTKEDIYKLWNEYTPDKDFTPPILAGVSLSEGTLSYIGARTGVGKTTAAINITREALDAKRRVLFLTLEESTSDIFRKLILSTAFADATDKDKARLRSFPAGVSSMAGAFHATRKGKDVIHESPYLAELFEKKVISAKKKMDAHLDAGALSFCEGRYIPDLDVLQNIIAPKLQQGDILIVDFIQRLPQPAGRYMDNYLRGKAQSQALFSIAKNTGAVVISGAQFKRGFPAQATAPEGYRPFDDESFRESGDIEQDGDCLFGIGDGGLQRENRYLKILKVRSGRGREQCYALDFEGAFNYMGIGEDITDTVKTYNEKKVRETKSETNKNKKEIDPDDPREGWA